VHLTERADALSMRPLKFAAIREIPDNGRELLGSVFPQMPQPRLGQRTVQHDRDGRPVGSTIKRAHHHRVLHAEAARRDRLLPFVLRHVVTEKSLAWIYEHHLDWQSGVAPGERAA
jgi:hypothetical protein